VWWRCNEKLNEKEEQKTNLLFTPQQDFCDIRVILQSLQNEILSADLYKTKFM
jgi:hypothetical protein